MINLGYRTDVSLYLSKFLFLVHFTVAIKLLAVVRRFTQRKYLQASLLHLWFKMSRISRRFLTHDRLYLYMSCTDVSLSYSLSYYINDKTRESQQNFAMANHLMIFKVFVLKLFQPLTRYIWHAKRAKSKAKLPNSLICVHNRDDLSYRKIFISQFSYVILLHW